MTPRSAAVVRKQATIFFLILSPQVNFFAAVRGREKTVHRNYRNERSRKQADFS
jgi:hypothetical protein